MSPPTSSPGSWGRDLLEAAAQALPARRLCILDLVYSEGLLQRDIADRLDLPMALVSTEVAAALAAVAELVCPTRSI